MTITKLGSFAAGMEAFNKLIPYYSTARGIASGDSTLGGALGGIAGGYAGSKLTDLAMRFLPEGRVKTGLTLAGNLFLGGKLSNIGTKIGNKRMPLFKRKGYDYLNSYPQLDESGNLGFSQVD